MEEGVALRESLGESIDPHLRTTRQTPRDLSRRTCQKDAGVEDAHPGHKDAIAAKRRRPVVTAKVGPGRDEQARRPPGAAQRAPNRRPSRRGSVLVVVL